MKLKEMKLEHIMLSMKSPGEKIRKHITGAGGNLLSILKLGTIVHGKCIPSVCSDMDVYFGYHNFFINESVLGHAGQNITAWAINSHTVDDKIDLEDGDWVMIAIFVVFGVLILTGTVIDVVLNILHLDVVPDKLVQIFQGFSLYQNTLKLFNTGGGGADSLDCINGIRFLSMTWVLVGHSYGDVLNGFFINNLYVIGGDAFAKNGAFASVANAFPSVDSFFLIGSTLLAFITLKELDKTNGGNIKFWIMFYVHRYIRLTGVYAMVIGFHATFLKFFATGPQSHILSNEYCKNYWYYNILYVNNLKWIFEDPNMTLSCLGQTWYMANDMQFFIFSPIILWTLWRHEKVGLILSGLLTIVATAIPFALAWTQDYPFSPSLPAGAPEEATQGYMTDFYIVPWCRYQPYIVGLVLGYFLHKMRKQPKLKLNSVILTWIWAVAFAVGASVIYGLFPYQSDFFAIASTTERSIYNGFHRLAWSISLSWVILACVKGVGGPVNTILSWKAWVPLARMSYCIYLVHLTVMSYYQSLPSYTVTVSQAFCIYFTIFILFVCIGIAYICVMAFEAPIVHLEKLLFAMLGISRLPAVRHVKKNT